MRVQLLVENDTDVTHDDTVRNRVLALCAHFSTGVATGHFVVLDEDVTASVQLDARCVAVAIVRAVSGNTGKALCISY